MKKINRLKITQQLIAIVVTSFWLVATVQAKCEGNFVNPITDICWDCLFPISIGDTKVVSADYPDTKNPTVPVEVCVWKALFHG